MQVPNYSNPLCPCCNLPTSYNGRQKSGADQYRCHRDCKNERGKSVTFTISNRLARALGQKDPKTKTQKQYDEKRQATLKAWKERDPIGYAASQKYRNAKRQAKLKAAKNQS